MNMLAQLHSEIRAYVEGGKLSELRAWFAPLVLDIEACEEPDAVRAAYAIQRLLADYDEGYLSEGSLRLGLAVLQYPSQFVSSYQEVAFSPESAAVVSATSSTFEESAPDAFAGAGFVAECV